MCNNFTFSFGFCIWDYSSNSKIVYETTRKLKKNSFCKHGWVVLVHIIWNEINNMISSIFSKSFRPNCFIISFKSIHIFKVSITDSNNNNCKRICWSSNNLINCSFHIIDNTISNNQQDLEFLIVLITWVGFANIVHFADHIFKISWAWKLNVLNNMLITSTYFCQISNSWIKYITVHCETMWSLSHVWLNTSTKTIEIYFFRSIIELEDAPYLLNYLHILIVLHIKIM